MSVRTELVEVGTRVSYADEDSRREGRVTEIRSDESPDRYLVAWDDSPVPADVWTDLAAPGWHVLADLPGSIFDGADVIHAYTRQDAINDGTLTPAHDLVPDEPLFVAQAGWPIPVALSVGVTSLVIPTEREAYDYHQDVKGRLWDLLSMARMYRRGQTEWLFPCIFQLAGPDRARWTKRAAAKTIRLKAVGGVENGLPYLTICLPEED